jgi:hypothetical protein
MLNRSDIGNGAWRVEDCRAVRGEPSTDLTNRVMFAPREDTPVARVIRAHEMLHAKVSPNAEQWAAWVARGIASETALIVCEELRVNYLAGKAGFPVAEHLSDGSELSAGERMAKDGDWAGCVAMAIATAGTAGHKQFLNGVRRANRDWGKHLKSIATRGLKEVKKADKGSSRRSRVATLGTAEHLEEGHLLPLGFAVTERIAEWVDRLAAFPPPPPETATAGAAGATTGEDGNKDSGTPRSGDVTASNEGDTHGEARRGGNPSLSKIVPTSEAGRTAPSWGDLRLERLPMPRYSKGSIGKRRVATNMGRRPRRIHRMLTDPSMRVFDRTVRGNGGMVIIDGSGSMDLSLEQVANMTEAAGGCTVMIYSDRSYDKDRKNAWVVADAGRMVETLDGADYGYGNGVDFPAIEWGVKNRPNSRVPVIWVTDGGVCGAGDRFSNLLAMQCIEYARRNNIIIAPDADTAVAMLRRLNNGERVDSEWPHYFREVYREMMGVSL